MKRLTLLVIVIMMIGIGVGCDKTFKAEDGKPLESKDWKSFETRDGWFRADFPESPKKEEWSIPTRVGNVEIYNYSVESTVGTYGVGYFDFYDLEVNVDLESSEFMESMRRRTFSTTMGAYTKKKNIEFEGFPGIEAEGPYKKGSVKGLAIVRYYVVEKRIYLLYVMGTASFVNYGDTEKFFNSFGLIYEDE